MRVVGLDPGSRRTGFGVVEKHGNVFRCVCFGTAAPPARLGLPERLHQIARRIGEVLDEARPDAVAIEEAFYHESVRSTLVLGHVRGALLVAVVERGLAIAEYSPREIKMSVTGNGAASKEQVGFMVRRVLGLSGTVSPDGADALAAALCHQHRAGRATPARRAAGAAARGLEALLARQTRR